MIFAVQFSIEAATAIQDTIVSNIQWINDLAEKQSKGTIWLQEPEVNYTGYEPGGKPIKPGTAPLSVGIKLDGKGNWGLFDFYPKVK